MPRITGVPADGDDAGEYAQILAHRPEITAAMRELRRVMRTDRLLPDRLVELVRLRCAFWNQCRSCMATRFPEAFDDGLTEGVICSLERPQDAEDLTRAERSAIAYADMMATDHLAVTDATFDDLRQYFTEAQIVELAINVAYNVGFGRFTAVLDLSDGIPDEFRAADGLVGPWEAGEVVTAAPRQS